MYVQYPSIQNILYFVSCVAFHIGTSLQAAYKHLASLQSTDTPYLNVKID